MHVLAAVVAIFSVITAVIGVKHGDGIILLLAATGLLCAYTTYQTPKISSFLRIFAAIFAIETVAFGVFFLIAQVGLWPESLQDYALPESLPLTVAIFAILVYAISFVPVVRQMTRIGDRYFNFAGPTTACIRPFPSFSVGERTLAIAMVVFLVVVNQAQVGMQLRLSFFSRDWFNAIQNKDQATFWSQLFAVFIPWAFIYICSAILEFVIASTLIIRWRRWLTEDFAGRWLDRHTHYRMSLGGGADNPDQRISEDVNRFINGGETGGYGIYSFSILLISTLSSLVSFSILLWLLSANFTLPYTTIAFPGFLFWVALIYAGIGTWITHLIGRSLVQLSFTRQRYEADFRFSLARLREYAEQVALLKGETSEKHSLRERFAAIIGNYFQIVAVRKNLIGFTSFYGQLSPIIPYIVAAPFYFAGKITLGVMTQTARAFGSVNEALTFFVNYYVSLAEFKAVLDRLTSFDSAIESADAPAGLAAPAAPGAGEHIGLDAVTLRLPDGRVIVRDATVRLAPQESTLLTGPSGSGKSTLLRAISGIWPFGEGAVSTPPGAKVMLLPQKPYIPIGTLLAAVTYPAAADSFSEETVRDALVSAHLPELLDQLHVVDNWGQRLSGGEQQRLAVARALLAKPDWLFLDEATAAMDETMESNVYEVLFRELRNTTIVSIGHRSSLLDIHQRHIELQPQGEEGSRIGEKTVVA